MISEGEIGREVDAIYAIPPPSVFGWERVNDAPRYITNACVCQGSASAPQNTDSPSNKNIRSFWVLRVKTNNIRLIYLKRCKSIACSLESYDFHWF